MEHHIRSTFLRGMIAASPSKSYTHRAIICASLANGLSKITNYLKSTDIDETISALKSFGIYIKESNGTLEIGGNENFSAGGLYKLGKDENEIRINVIEYSGSSLRFLIPVSALAKTQRPIAFTRKGRLRERPIEPLLEAMRKLGVNSEIRKQGNIELVIIQPGIEGGETEIMGDISSQFITGLLFACPRAENDTEITVTTELESKPYVELTLGVLKDFGIEVKASKDLRKFNIPGNQHYKSREFKVEGDYSSAAFLLAAGAINGCIEVNGLNINSKQGDKKILNILKRMGAEIEVEEESIYVKTSELKGIKIDGGDIPDLIPICAVLGCFADGKTIITNAERLRIKESDRLAAITKELTKMGANITESNDGLIIYGKCNLRGAEINPHNDHRIAMACAIAGLSAEGETTINNSECVNKSYPSFFEDLRKLVVNRACIIDGKGVTKPIPVHITP